jgi:16S rRNA C967 or C1407 C5-methylase (RsmB/RsmF family)
MRRAMASATTSAVRLSRRLDKFGAETVWQEFTPLAREMGAVNLGQGFPDWPTPAFVKDAMKRSQDEDHNQYCRSAGHPPLVQALADPAPLDLRVNTMKAKRDEVRQALAEAGIAAEPTPHSPWGLRLEGKPALNKLPLFTQGQVEIQDEGSQLLALLTDAKRGEMVVDFCAGAGGKTLALGAAMRNTGRLYAFDVSGHRLDAIKPRLARSGLSNVHPAQLAHERDDRVKRLAGKIDRVLVDAPCSGLGTLRRSPDLKWRQSPQTVQDLQAKQMAILASAARHADGGCVWTPVTARQLAEAATGG